MRRIRKIPFTVTCDATNNTVPTTAPTKSISGKLLGIKVYTPASVDNSATITAAVKDSDGDAIFSKAAIAANAKDLTFLTAGNVPIAYPLGDTMTITATFSATQTVPRVVTIYLYIEDYVS